MAISRNKSKFLEQHSEQRKTASLDIGHLYYLAREHSQLNYMANEIILNGETLTGQTMINDTVDILKRFHANKKEPVHPNLIYVLFAAYYWQPKDINKSALFAHISPLLQDIIKIRRLDQITLCKFSKNENDSIKRLFAERNWLDEHNHVKPFNDIQFRRLVFTLSDFFRYDCYDRKKPVYQHGIMVFCLNLLQTLNEFSISTPLDICFNRFQAMHEIESIQRTLNPNNVVGYVFTEDVRIPHSGGHTEALIITKERIIKPLHWSGLEEERTFKPYQFPQLYASDWLTGFFEPNHLNEAPLPFLQALRRENQPQRTGIGCGTLSILYLRQLLKQNCKLLKEQSLSFSIYTSMFSADYRASLHHLFIPPPRVLRYSQSDRYNTTLLRLMRNEKIAYSDNLYNDILSPYYTIVTFTELLTRSIATATIRDDERIIDENRALLEKFPDFQKNWLAEYAREEAKRARLSIGVDRNLYLTYKSYQVSAHRSDLNPNSSYYELMWITLPKEYKYIQHRAASLIRTKAFQALHYRDQYSVFLGFLFEILKESKYKIKFCGFGFFKTEHKFIKKIIWSVIVPLQEKIHHRPKKEFIKQYRLFLLKNAKQQQAPRTLVFYDDNIRNASIFTLTRFVPREPLRIDQRPVTSGSYTNRK